MNTDESERKQGKRRSADPAVWSLLLTLEIVTGKPGVEGEC